MWKCVFVHCLLLPIWMLTTGNIFKYAKTCYFVCYHGSLCKWVCRLLMMLQLILSKSSEVLHDKNWFPYHSLTRSLLARCLHSLNAASVYLHENNMWNKQVVSVHTHTRIRTFWTHFLTKRKVARNWMMYPVANVWAADQMNCGSIALLRNLCQKRLTSIVNQTQHCAHVRLLL